MTDAAAYYLAAAAAAANGGLSRSTAGQGWVPVENLQSQEKYKGRHEARNLQSHSLTLYYQLYMGIN